MALIKCKECGTEVSSKAESCPKCGAKVKPKGMGCGTLIAIIFLAVVMVSIFSMGNHTTSSSPASSPPAADPKQTALTNLEIKELNWHKGGFENVMLVDVTFLNKGTRDVKDIELTCEHYSNSGTRIDSNKRVIYEIVPARKSKSVKDFGMGFIHSQATKTSCSVTDLALK